MTKFDQFIHRELESRLHGDEKITLTGFLFKKSLLAMLLVPLAMAGSGYFLAAITPLRLLLIKTKMGIFSGVKMTNNGVVEIPFADVKSIQCGGVLSQKRITIFLKDGTALKYRLNTFAKVTSGQKEFIGTLCGIHAKAAKAPS